MTVMMEIKTPGEMIFITRSRLGMSLRTLADQTGVSFSTLSRLENNAPVKIESVMRAAAVLGITEQVLKFYSEVSK